MKAVVAVTPPPFQVIVYNLQTMVSLMSTCVVICYLASHAVCCDLCTHTNTVYFVSVQIPAMFLGGI